MIAFSVEFVSWQEARSRRERLKRMFIVSSRGRSKTLVIDKSAVASVSRAANLITKTCGNSCREMPSHSRLRYVQYFGPQTQVTASSH